MKAERKTESVFVPVILTLESQAEVDAIYALVVQGQVSRAVGLIDAWRLLETYASQGSNAKFAALNNLINKAVLE